MSGPRLVLWDVDGTLLKAGSAGRLAFADAIEEVVGVRVHEDLLPRMGGKTDPQIAREILVGLGVEAPEDRLAAVESALERAVAGRCGQMRREGTVLPGVRDALDALDAAGVVQTLVTGNVAANARAKLTALGLITGGGEAGGPLRLELGGYGSDHHDRANLVPVALARARAAGLDVCASRAWVVGDTPRDLACARSAGVRCLLVATGGYSRADLEAAGADAVLVDLRDTRRVVALLTAGGARQGAG